jgi:hypothetical protein
MKLPSRDFKEEEKTKRKDNTNRRLDTTPNLSIRLIVDSNHKQFNKKGHVGRCTLSSCSNANLSTIINRLT